MSRVDDSNMAVSPKQGYSKLTVITNIGHLWLGWPLGFRQAGDCFPAQLHPVQTLGKKHKHEQDMEQDMKDDILPKET